MFGDSIVDTGNNNNLKTIFKVNYPPYGKDFEGGIPTGRFSNGKVPSDLFVEELGIKELLPAYLDPNLQTEDLKTGVNFASGGAGFDPLTSALARVARERRGGAQKCNPWGLPGAHSMLLCAEGAGSEAMYLGGVVVLRDQREIVRWLDVTGDWSLGTTIGIRAKFESPESHRSDFGGERKPISNSDQIQSAQKWRLSIPPDSSRRDEAPAPNGVKIGLQTSPHAPPEVRRVRSTRPTRSRRGRRLENAPRKGPTRAARTPTCAQSPARAATRLESGSKSQPSSPRALTRPSQLGEWRQLAATRATRPSRSVVTRQPPAPSRAAPTRAGLSRYAMIRADPVNQEPLTVDPSQVSDFARKALSEFSRHSGFIREIMPCGKPRMKDMEEDVPEKQIRQIKQCIGHEHEETSAHGLWTKLKEMYREKTSQNKALMRRLVLKLQRRNTVEELTSEFQRS
ncbi:GDSL-like Lipase/Acylhydrolase superfamily protein [Actinidia rufa]|uniref:GDSL-like Lipase/Acylhydrolase superfamily protein n=1 Tax=Actinidia rufa TaxID=165716 RepID=A0A7J0GI33_9ERIC|nr:GDSL-like Lipase/Acylhydrolase superfamily protein [Actinidia rufa]